MSTRSKPKAVNTTFTGGEQVVVKATGAKGKVLAPTSRPHTYAVELENGVIASFLNIQLASALDEAFAATRAKVQDNLDSARRLLSETQDIVQANGLSLTAFNFSDIEDIVGEMAGHGWSSSSMDC